MLTQSQIIAIVVVIAIVLAAYFGYKYWEAHHPPKGGFCSSCPCGCTGGHCQCAAGCQCRSRGHCKRL